MRLADLGRGVGAHGPGGFARGISTYQKCAAETVARFGGFVAKYMGDGVLVYFGYPQATRTMPSGRCALPRN